MSTADERPDFELERYEDKTLKHGEQLFDSSELVGHTILAVISDPAGPFSDGTEIVIVTETRCWMVIEAEDGYSCEEAASAVIQHKGHGNSKVLNDYLSAADMRHAGLCGQGEYELLRKSETEREEKKKAEKADRLRKQLAELTGGAA